MNGNGRTRGLIRGRGRHRDPQATTIWRPRMPVSSTGVPVYVTAAVGAVVAGMITTVAPSTTAETTRTDPVGSQDSSSRDALVAALGSTPQPTVTAWPSTGVAQGQNPAAGDSGWVAAPAPPEPGKAGTRTYVLPSPAGVLRAGSAVRQMGRGVGSAFSNQSKPGWSAHPAVPLAGSVLPDAVVVGTVQVAMPSGAVAAFQAGQLDLPQLELAGMDRAVAFPPLRDPVAVVDPTRLVGQPPLAPLAVSSATPVSLAVGDLAVVPATVVEVPRVPVQVPGGLVPDLATPDVTSPTPSEDGVVLAQESSVGGTELSTELLTPRAMPFSAVAQDDHASPVLGEFLVEPPPALPQSDVPPLGVPQPVLPQPQVLQSVVPQPEDPQPVEFPQAHVPQPLIPQMPSAHFETPQPENSQPEFSEPVGNSTMPWSTQPETSSLDPDELILSDGLQWVPAPQPPPQAEPSAWVPLDSRLAVPDESAAPAQSVVPAPPEAPAEPAVPTDPASLEIPQEATSEAVSPPHVGTGEPSVEPSAQPPAGE